VGARTLCHILGKGAKVDEVSVLFHCYKKNFSFMGERGLAKYDTVHKSGSEQQQQVPPGVSASITPMFYNSARRGDSLRV